MSALTDADLDALDNDAIGSGTLTLTTTTIRALIADLRATRALLREATVELIEDEGADGDPWWEWTTRCPTVLTDEQATLLRSILDGAG